MEHPERFPEARQAGEDIPNATEPMERQLKRGYFPTSQRFTNESAARNFAAGLETDGWEDVKVEENDGWVVSGIKRQRP